MNIKIAQKNGVNVAVLTDTDILVNDMQSALDLIATVNYETGCDRVVLDKAALHEDFFRLSSGLAGEILQKFVTYHLKFAVYGDFSGYTSKPLKDFMYESNQGNAVFFAENEEDAIDRLSAAGV